jgi:hypothetical protein
MKLACNRFGNLVLGVRSVASTEADLDQLELASVKKTDA